MRKRFDYRRELKNLSEQNRAYRIVKLKDEISYRMAFCMDCSIQVRDLSYLESLNKQL